MAILSGMGKKNQPGGRSGRKMSKSEKALNRPESDGHLFRSKQLAEDSVKQEGFINTYRKRDGLPPIKRTKAPEDKTSIEYHEGDRLGVESGDLILAQRLYSRDQDGKLVGSKKSEEECMAAHSRIRRERANYRELDGRMVMAGDVIGIRKGKYMKARKDDKRRAPGVLRSIMVRLMPHEGEIVGQYMGSEGIAKAMDETVREFADALGCDVVSAVAHRMTGWDCHIHIQYTMIQPFEETASMLGRRLKPWKEKASAMARAALGAEGNDSPAPRTVGAKIKALIEAGDLEPRPVAGTEYRKAAGKRSLMDNAILGYSFRHKLNLVRIAEEAGDSELAEKVTKMRDGDLKFRPFTKREDAELEKQYLDLWLERVWRRSIREQLPEIAVEKLLPAGVESATDYVTYGTVLVEETHVETRKKELDAQKAELDATVATVRNKAAALTRKARTARSDALKELERVRNLANDKLRERQTEFNALEKRNYHLGGLVARFIEVFVMLFDLPAFQALLDKAPKKVRDAVNSLKDDVDKEIAGLGGDSPQKDPEIGTEVEPDSKEGEKPDDIS